LIGSLASWLRHGKWRSTARRFERELQQLRGKIAAHEGTPAKPPQVPEQSHPPPRLRPPAR
jgi:hypothetical protein